MVRIAVVVEGLTEAAFVDQLLAGYLLDYGVYSTPTSLGGRISVARLASQMADLFWSFDAVTSLVDFYGFRDKGISTVDQLEQDVAREVAVSLGSNWDTRRIMPYVQLHEFEGLLFSQINGFVNIPGADDSVLEQLARVRLQFSSPEDINDSPNTAPSRRIVQILPDYVKSIDGPQIAQAIGLATIRRECPRFNSWLTRLESLDNSQATSP